MAANKRDSSGLFFHATFVNKKICAKFRLISIQLHLIKISTVVHLFIYFFFIVVMIKIRLFEQFTDKSD